MGSYLPLTCIVLSWSRRAFWHTKKIVFTQRPSGTSKRQDTHNTWTVNSYFILISICLQVKQLNSIVSLVLSTWQLKATADEKDHKVTAQVTRSQTEAKRGLELPTLGPSPAEMVNVLSTSDRIWLLMNFRNSLYQGCRWQQNSVAIIQCREGGWWHFLYS